MTRDEFVTWGSSKFYSNGKRLITAADVMQLVTNLVATFAHIDAPFPVYEDYIAQANLGSEGNVTITHNLGTDVPIILMFNELDERISSEYFAYSSADRNSVDLTIFGVIPATGTGYYKVLIYKITDTIEIPQLPTPGNSFSDDFALWESAPFGQKPQNWNINTLLLTATRYFQNINSTLHINDPGTDPQLELIAANFLTQSGVKYQLQFTLTRGAIEVIIGTQKFLVTNLGTYSVTFTAAASTNVKVRRGRFFLSTLPTPIIDNFSIQPTT